MADSFLLDGLQLNDLSTFGVLTDGFQCPPPRERREWIGAADSEAQLLARTPKHENREVTIPIAVMQQANVDLVFDKIGQVVDKLVKASKYPDGLTLAWTAHGSSRTINFDVLAGELPDLPTDWESGFQALSPQFNIVLTCKPYWRGTETLTSTTSSSTPHVTAELVNNSGDVPALGRLIVTDTATQSRRFVEWGLEGPLTYNASTALIIDSDSMTTSGFAGTGSTQSGAYDPNASGNNVVSMSLLGPQAMCGFSGSHSGVFRVRGRFYCNTGDPASTKIRLVWKDQDNPQSFNAFAPVIVGIGWNSLDLGTITTTGAWSGYIEAQSPYYTETLKLDYLELVPVTDGYGKARATYTYQAGVTVGRDEFTSSTAAAVLHTATSGRAAPVGGNWVTSGAATDFAYADDYSDEQVKRSTVSDAGGRFAILGSSNFSDVEVSAAVSTTGAPVTPAGTVQLGVIARWTDSSNYLRGVLLVGASTTYLQILTTIAGVETVLSTAATSSFGLAQVRILRLLAFASGRALLQLVSTDGAVLASADSSSSTLATGGTLATGKPGLFDRNTVSAAATRYYDNFVIATPPAEPIAIYSGRNMQIRHDTVYRQNSGGTANGNPPSYRGSRFLVPVGTSRVFVKARRNDVDATEEANVTDALQIQVGVTPRGLGVPRA